MSTKYVCEIDGSIFSTEEELIKHLKKKYVKEFKNKSTDVSEIYDVLKENFPDWKINIENGAGWYATYIIRLNKDKTQIEQYYGNDKDDNDKSYTYKGNPENFKDLVSNIKWKIETAEQMVRDINSIGDFEDIYCKEFNHGYTSDEHHFTFLFKLKGWEDYSEERYYPWGENNDKEAFINNFKQYFVDKLEGEMHPYFYDGYFTGYVIDGVNINGLVRRAKKVRLEIIE